MLMIGHGLCFATLQADSGTPSDRRMIFFSGLLKKIIVLNSFYFSGRKIVDCNSRPLFALDIALYARASKQQLRSMDSTTLF